MARCVYEKKPPPPQKKNTILKSEESCFKRNLNVGNCVLEYSFFFFSPFHPTEQRREFFFFLSHCCQRIFSPPLISLDGSAGPHTQIERRGEEKKITDLGREEGMHNWDISLSLASVISLNRTQKKAGGKKKPQQFVTVNLLPNQQRTLNKLPLEL